MKSKIISFVSVFVILLASCVASFKLYTTSFYTSHDGEGHVIRMMEYDEAVKDGQMPVRMTKRINYGLGYPFFNFNYPSVYAIGQFFHDIGFSFVDSFKMLMFVGTIIGGLGMFVFMRTHVAVLPALLSALFYIFVPYRFLNIYVRGNPAENLALGVLPLLLCTIDRLILTNGKKYVLFVLVGSFFVLSHNTTVLMASPFVILYFFLRLPKKGKRTLIFRSCFSALFLIALCTSFFWLPVAVETRLTKLVELGEDYIAFFPTLKEVLYSPWGFGAYVQGVAPGKMSPQIGLIHEAVGAGAVLLLLLGVLKKKKESFTIQWFFVGASLLALFLMLPVSKGVWDTLPLLRFIQIPWRFLGIIALSLSCLAGFVLSALPVSKYVKLVGCVVLVTVLVYANRNHIRVNQDIVFANPFLTTTVYGPSTTSKDEHMPRSAPRIYTAPDPNGTIIAKSGGTSVRTTWKTNLHVFTVTVKEDGMFRDNTSYFPGWIATVDGKGTEIVYNEDEYKRLRVALRKGTHTVIFQFTEPWYRRIADIVSLVSFTVLSIRMLIRKGKGI